MISVFIYVPLKLITAVTILIMFALLMFNMKYKHYYEYLIHRRWLFLYFLGVVISKGIYLAHILSRVNFSSLFDFDQPIVLINMKNPYDLLKECQMPDLFARALFQLAFVFCKVDGFMVCAIIILIKGRNDVLCGISKLDYLLKVSIWQVYKNPQLRTSNAIISTEEE